MTDEWLTIFAAIAGLALLTQRWFWLLAFGIGGLACFYVVLASIIHFQILGALGATFGMVVCVCAFAAIADAAWR